MAESRAPRIVILGGGISGLSATFRLLELSAKHEAPFEVALLEGGPCLGGALHTIREDGFIAAAGAASFLPSTPWWPASAFGGTLSVRVRSAAVPASCATERWSKSRRASPCSRPRACCRCCEARCFPRSARRG